MDRQHAGEVGRTAVCLCGVALVATCLTGCAAPPESRAAGFGATVYTVQLPADRPTAVNLTELTGEAGNERALLRALSRLGESHILYRLYQPVGLSSDTRIMLGQNRPFVSNTRMTSGNRRINTVQYEHVGVILKLSCKPVAGSDGRMVNMRLDAELADMGEGKTEIAQDVRAAVTRTVAMSYDGPVKIGVPFVTLSVDSSPGGKDARSVAYVCRIVLSELP